MAWFQDFRDQTVLVTGASSGIGRRRARLSRPPARSRGAGVARRRAAPRRSRALAGGETAVLPADVTKREDVRACFAAAKARFGRIDVVVNNAGVLLPAPIAEITGADLDAIVAGQSLRRVVRDAGSAPDHAGAERGRDRQRGVLAGRRGVSPLGGYCASKFALIGLTEALRTELHDRPLHVGLVLPGSSTPRWSTR